jgi:uncharacterized protein YndB with AHSA1/START domain
MRQFSITVDIGASPQRVWAVMTDFARWPEWTASVSSIRKVGKGEIAPGARIVIRQPGFPPALWVMRTFDPGAGFTWESGFPGLRVFARHSISTTPSGSRVTLSLEFAGLLGGAFGRWTRDVNNRYLAMEASGLKRRSEEPEHAQRTSDVAAAT